jgi:hypothetical protein
MRELPVRPPEVVISDKQGHTVAVLLVIPTLFDCGAVVGPAYVCWN